jgi:hypothetical protein
MARITVGDLQRILEGLPSDMPVVIDSQHEQSCGYYAEAANVTSVGEPFEEDEDEVPGDVGDPKWLGRSTGPIDVLWISQWGWRNPVVE